MTLLRSSGYLYMRHVVCQASLIGSLQTAHVSAVGMREEGSDKYDIVTPLCSSCFTEITSVYLTAQDLRDMGYFLLL